MKPFLVQLKTLIFSRYFIMHIGLVILFYLAVVFFMMVYLKTSTKHGERIAVPNIVGISSERGKIILEDLGLSYQIIDSVFDPTKPTGTILSQSPGPTESTLLYVKSGRIISLRVSKQTELREMPYLINRQVRFAERSLKKRGLNVIIRYKPTDEANGSVLDVLYNGRPIKEGVMVPVGSTITLIVGENDQTKPVLLPNLLGLTYFEAKERLDSLGVPSSFIYTNCPTRADSLSARVFIQSPEYIQGQIIPISTPFVLHLGKPNDNPIEEIEEEVE
jgi:beta-lactam-binding protein with PASTA domain